MGTVVAVAASEAEVVEDCMRNMMTVQVNSYNTCFLLCKLHQILYVN